MLIAALLLAPERVSAEHVSTPERSHAPSANQRVGPASERWAGRQIVLGEQSFTFVGTLDTRAESFTLAEVKTFPERYVITQTTCRVDMNEVAGVKAVMKDRVARSIPPVTFEIPRAPDGSLEPVRWEVNWGEADHDGDEQKGVTVQVAAPLCGGEIYLSSRTRTRGFFFERDGALEASLEVEVHQRIFDTSNVCLDLATSDSVENVSGRVKYVPVERTATCEGLLRRGWPVPSPL